MSRQSILLVLLGALAAAAVLASEGQSLSVRELMTPAEFRASGLAKLTPAEEAALNEWLHRFVRVVEKAVSERDQASSGSARAPRPRDSYEVEVSHNDELFIINGERFEAQTYCFNVEEGDRVLFIEGSPYGACSSATFINLRTKDKCKVWCE